MKKRILTAILTATLCAATILPIAACGGGDESSGHDFTVLTVKEDTVNDYNTMPVFKALAEETGKDVYWKSQTGTQYGLNTDPVGIRGIDAIYHSGFSNLKLYDYGRKKRIVAIDQHLDSMPNLKKILESRPDIKDALQSPDGHIYSLPRVEEMGLKAYPNILFINKKWVEKLIDTNKLPANVTLTKEDLVDGLDLTRNQFKAILQKFNDNDMDDKIKDDEEIPLTFVSDNWQGNESDLIASFGVPENQQHKTIQDGKVIFTIQDERWFNAIKELNAWNKEGLIRASAFTQKDSNFLAKGQDGRYGAFYWWEKETVVSSDKQKDYIIVKPLIDDETGERYVGVSNELEIEKGACVILSKCKDQDGLLSYFDKFYEPDYSAQLNYGSIESGAFKAEKENGKLIPNEEHGAQSADDFRMKNAPYGCVYLTKEVWENNVQMESRAVLRLERLDSYVKPYTCKGVVPIPNLNYTAKELTDLLTCEQTLADNIKGWMTTAITGSAAPTKESWQKLLNDNKTSIETVKALNQAAYDRYLKVINK